MKNIYLDYNATTPIAPSVQEAMAPFLSEHFGNPSSSHTMGRACSEAIEDSRSKIASMLGADVDEIVFTSCGTESNNLALKGVMMRQAPSVGGHLVISAIEHPAIMVTAKYLEKIGFDLTIVPCNEHGVVQANIVENALRPDTLLVSIMHANNETGVVQPIRAIAEACHSRDILFHTDAAQSVGKIRTAVDELNVDMLTTAGHKIYSPKGVGVLFVRRGVHLEPIIHGAGHECGLRAGTENVPYIVALGRSALLASRGLDDAADRLARLRDRLYARLRSAVGPNLTINGALAERLPNTLSVNFPKINGYDLLARTPELMASTGSACHSGNTNVSPTLQAMGLDPEIARGCVRLSVGWYTSEEDIDKAANLLIAAWESLSEAENVV